MEPRENTRLYNADMASLLWRVLALSSVGDIQLWHLALSSVSDVQFMPLGSRAKEKSSFFLKQHGKNTKKPYRAFFIECASKEPSSHHYTSSILSENVQTWLSVRFLHMHENHFCKLQPPWADRHPKSMSTISMGRSVRHIFSHKVTGFYSKWTIHL